MEKELAITKQLSPLVVNAEKLSIKKPEDMEEATEMLSKLNKVGDSIEEEKMKVMRPLLDATAAERKRWKPAEMTLEKAIDIVRRKMTVWQTAARKKADEEEAKIAARIGSGKGKFTMETAMRRADEIDKPETAIATGSGLVKFRTVPKFEIVDEAKVPREYLVIDEAKVRESMKEGKEIAGIRFYTEEVPVNTR